MKTRLFGLLMIVCSQVCIGQKSNICIEKDFFLIGTLSDYMGRQKYPEKRSVVDEYNIYEFSLAFKIDSLFKSNYPDYKFVISDRNKHDSSITIYSNQLADKIDDYYVYKPSGAMTMDRDTIYYGSLKSDIFETDQQRYSFLAGVYVRFGVENDSIFTVRINNGPSKAKIFYDLLNKMKCHNVSYEILSTIPVAHIVYFTPTFKLNQYLMRFMYLRNKLNNDWVTYFKGLIGEDNYNKLTKQKKR